MRRYLPTGKHTSGQTDFRRRRAWTHKGPLLLPATNASSADGGFGGGYLAPRHGGADQAGLLFFDGHAEMRTKSYIKNNAYYLLAYDDPE